MEAIERLERLLEYAQRIKDRTAVELEDALPPELVDLLIAIETQADRN
jgi:hypothetical protein